MAKHLNIGYHELKSYNVEEYHAVIDNMIKLGKEYEKINKDNNY